MGQDDAEGAALADLGSHLDPAAMGFDQTGADVKAQPGRRLAHGAGRAGGEGLEQLLHPPRLDALAVIRHHQPVDRLAALDGIQDQLAGPNAVAGQQGVKIVLGQAVRDGGSLGMKSNCSRARINIRVAAPARTTGRCRRRA